MSETPKSLSIGATEIRKLSSGHWPEVYIHVGPKSNHGNCVATVSMGGAGATSVKVEDVQATAEKIVDSYNSFDDLLAALKLCREIMANYGWPTSKLGREREVFEETEAAINLAESRATIQSAGGK